MKEQKSPIICMAFTAFRGNFAKSTTQIVGRLAQEHPVLYIDYQYTFKDLLDNLLGRKKLEWKRILGLRKRLCKISTEYNSDVYVLSLPPVFPVNWINNYGLFKKGLRLNTFLIKRAVNKAMKELSFQNAIVINAYNPFFGLYSRSIFKNEKIIYYCYDEINGSPWAQKHGGKIEKEFLKVADKVVTSSASLQKEKSKFHNDVHLVENGVDFEMFNQQLKTHKSSAGKIIGYIGSLDERIDYSLIQYLAEQKPDYEFRLIGRVVFPELLEPLKKLPNVKLQGSVAYKMLPEELNQFDVCLIPFLKTEFTKNIYPLKINEYLSMGKAVIKTDFAHLPEFDQTVWTAESKEDFLHKIEEALKPTGINTIDDRVKLAAKNSWSNRVQLFSELIAINN